MLIHTKQRLFLILFAIAIVAASCSPKVVATKPGTSTVVSNEPIKPAVVLVKGPHFTTDSVYMAKTDSMLSIMRMQKPAMLMDTTGIVAIPSEWVGTVNFGMRKANYVIIHYTAQDSIQQTIKTFTVPVSQVSAHYVVAKDGKVFHMVNDYLRANQAGIGKWGSVVDMNSISLGIEIDNNGFEPFTDAQIKSLLQLLTFLKKTYNIPAANFIGHQDFAPTRKPDPGPLFPWQLLAAKGFGFWSDMILVPAPANFDVKTALRLIGYDTSDLNSAIIAFKRHFVQLDSTPVMSQLDLNVLYNVYQKY